MGKSRHLLAVAAVLSLGAFGCSETLAPLDPASPEAGTHLGLETSTPEALVTQLVTARDMNVGTVTVTNDDELLYVTFTTTDDWTLVRTRMAVEASLDDLPKGRSPRSSNLVFFGRKSGMTEYTYEVPLDDTWLPGQQEIYVVADARVRSSTPTARRARTVQAWAEGEPFPGRAWNEYFTYSTEARKPAEDCTLTVTYPNGGETLCVFQYAAITWECSGRECGETVRIEMLHNGVPCMIIDENAPNDGFYSWFEVQQCGWETQRYVIRVTDVDRGTSDESDGGFLINICPE